MKVWHAIAIGFVAGVILGAVAAYFVDPKPAPVSVDVVRELAAERIEDAKAEEQTKRRAARARVDQEVSRAVRDSDLVDYLNTRSHAR